MNFRKIVKFFIPRSLFKRIEPWGHLGEAVLLNLLHGFPARGLKVIGVTGTDGKTTTCMLIAQMLRQSGYKVGLITTVAVDYADGHGERPSPTSLTTASVGLLHGMFKKIKANRPDYVVLETSSHALAQHRVFGVPYTVAALTNMSHEHLDYHGTFENYVRAKLKLFQLTAANKKGLRTGVVNADDAVAARFNRVVPKSITYGLKGGELRAGQIKTTAAGSRFTAKSDSVSMNIQLNLPGQFNVYNALAAAGVGLAIGLEPKQIEQGLASLKQVAGRMTRLEAGQAFNVFIDYAVTPAALQNALQAAKQASKGKVMLVFGATGDRDKAKRPVMGEVAAYYADQIFLTDDETYTENPQAIINAVHKGIETAGGAAKTTIVNDRLAAIRTALKTAKAGDTVLITGIGHETSRNMGGQKVPWNEIEIVKNLLKNSARP